MNSQLHPLPACGEGGNKLDGSKFKMHITIAEKQDPRLLKEVGDLCFSIFINQIGLLYRDNYQAYGATSQRDRFGKR